MKQHMRKKATRLTYKLHAQAGRINLADGTWVSRSSIKESSMRRDYSPQGKV